MALNPFSHDHGHHSHGPDHHGHDHDHHGHDHEEPLDLDPAQQSLADALKVSFSLLTVVMVILVVMYLFSGIFTVREQQAAVVLRFGEIVGDPGQQVLEPGVHFTLPYPVSSVEFISTAPRTVQIDTDFMYEITEQERGQSPDQLSGRPLNPERDGSLITADANIVHGRFQVIYQIDDPVTFLTHVGLAAYGESLGDDRYVMNDRDRLARLDRLVRTVAQQVIIEMAATADADAMIRQQIQEQQTDATLRMQQILDKLGAGVTVQRLVLTEPQMPRSVRDAYQAVINAESEKTQRIDEARKERTDTLVKVAGQAAQPLPDGSESPLMQLINDYTRAAAQGDREQAAQARDHVERAFDQRAVQLDGVNYPIGGEAAQIINQAEAYRTQVVERVKGESQRFLNLLERYQDNPQLLLQRRWQEARAEILSGDVETIYVRPESHLRIDITGDPEVARQREERRLEQQEQQRREQSANNSR